LRAAATQRVEPEYPAVARQIRLTGEVELEVLVDPSGAVEKANVLKGNTLLIGPSLQAIRKWKFKPFEGATGPARVTGPIKFNFQM
jgi:periplasmic protein TonB